MIQSIVNTITPLTSNTSSIQFPIDDIRTKSCTGCGWLCHSEGSGNFEITEGGIYEVNFDATVSSATVGVVAFALFNNGEQIPGTLMAENIAAAGGYSNIGINKKIKVCCNGNATITVRSVPAVPTATAPATPIVTQVPIIASANISVTRIC